jgi:hypothetical protein
MWYGFRVMVVERKREVGEFDLVFWKWSWRMRGKMSGLGLKYPHPHPKCKITILSFDFIPCLLKVSGIRCYRFRMSGSHRRVNSSHLIDLWLCAIKIQKHQSHNKNATKIIYSISCMPMIHIPLKFEQQSLSKKITNKSKKLMQKLKMLKTIAAYNAVIS